MGRINEHALLETDVSQYRLTSHRQIKYIIRIIMRVCMMYKAKSLLDRALSTINVVQMRPLYSHCEGGLDYQYPVMSIISFRTCLRSSSISEISSAVGT